MANRKTKVSAAVTGANGAALATLIIKEATEIGKFIEKKRTSRKDKLRSLCQLDHDGIVGFLTTMDKERNEISGQMKQAGFERLSDFFDVHAVPAAVYAEISLWQKLAKAVDTGFKPDYDKEWHVISKMATDALASAAAQGNKKSGNGKGTPVKRGRAETTPQAKAIKAARAALKDNKGQTLTANNRNLSEVVRGILADATVEELQEVAAVVQTQLDLAMKAREAAGKATAKAAQSSDKTVKTTSQGATVRRVAAPGATVTKKSDLTADKLEKQAKEIAAAKS